MARGHVVFAGVMVVAAFFLWWNSENGSALDDGTGVGQDAGRQDRTRMQPAGASDKVLVSSGGMASRTKDSGLLGSSGGHWSWCTHLIKYGINFNGGLARFLAYELKPTSVLEFGCGIGLYIDYLCRKCDLQRAYGIEPEPMLFDGSVFTTVDDRAKCPAQLTTNIFSAPTKELEQLGRFDLVYSIEVAEHLRRDQHGALAAFLAARTGKYLVFSAAHPGQGGTGHISERPREEWLAELESHGLEYMPLLTSRLQALMDARNKNHKANVMVLTRADSPQEDQQHADTALLRRGNGREAYQQLWPALVGKLKRLRSGTDSCGGRR